MKVVRVQPDSAEPVYQGPEGRVLEAEVFIRKTFEQDPRLGCEMLFHQYYKALCSHAVRALYSKALAEDIVAEVFCQFYDSRTYERITTSYRAYLYKAVRSRVYNHLRYKASRNTPLPDADQALPGTAASPQALMEFEEMYNSIQDAINAMPAQRRRIFLLYRFEGKRYAEIAEELGLSVRTVEVHLRNANLYLRQILEKKWGIVLTHLMLLVLGW